jgi:hypothetical protein
MWLLNTTTRQLRNFLNDIPDHMILSHTWGEDEVAFEELEQPRTSQKVGYDKILGCCQLALNDGFEWVWIDACCIDKRSSTELSEAINSMYKWYREAAVCYAYLSDVDSGCMGGASRIFEEGGRGYRDIFEEAHWFTRGGRFKNCLHQRLLSFMTPNGNYWGPKLNSSTKLSKSRGLNLASF